MKRKRRGGLTGILAGFLLTLFGLIMLLAVVLKETPLFWRNAGGYSVELRELVQLLYYPSLGAYFIMLGGGWLVGWKLFRQGRLDGAVMLLACLGNCLLFAVIVTVNVWNNVDNLIQGLPLHYHAP